MGWIESPPFFYAASETGRDVAAQYTNTPVGTLLMHKFTKYTTIDKDYKKLPQNKEKNGCSYMLEVLKISLKVPYLEASLK